MIKNPFKKSEEEINKPPEELPEHSIPLRIVVFLMASLTIGVSCYFSKIELPLFILFMSVVVSGNYFSYIYREHNLKWMKVVSFGGILLVGCLAVRGFLKPLATEFDLVAPFVIFLAGVFSFLCYEMRTKSDLNLASGIGLILICVSAPVAKGIFFGAAVLSYITLGVLMLYFDCIAKTASAWLNSPIKSAPEVQFGSRRSSRRKFGNTVSTVAIVPLIAILLFLFMPRPDGLVDKVMASLSTMNFDYIFDSLMPPKAPKKREKDDKGQTPKDWFMKNSSVIDDLKKNKDTKRNNVSQLKDKNLDKAKRSKKDKEKKKKNQTKKDKLKLEKIKSLNKIDEFKNKRKKTETLEKSSKTKKSSSDKNSKDKDKDSKSKESKTKESKKTKKAEAKEAKDKEGKVTKKTKSKSKKSSKKNSKGKNSKKKGEGKGKGAGTGKSGAKGKGDKSAKGKNNSGNSKSGGKSGKSGKSSGTSSGGGSSFSLSDEPTLDMRKSLTQPSVPVLEVQSRRIVYLRRKCFDHFDGIFWKVSKQKSKQKSVKVVDGKVKRELIKYVAPEEITRPKKVIDPKSILSSGGSAQDFKKNQGLKLNVGQGNAEPRKVKLPKDDSPRGLDFHAKLSKGRLFEFLSHGNPQFRVEVADALALPKRFPSIELTQEITVKAKSIGRIVPGAWIPKEISLKQSELAVDRLGVVKAGEPIKKDIQIKIKTKLPIFNIAYMRNADPIPASEEEIIRDNFADYLQLPKTITDELFELAENNTSPEFNWFVQSEQIAEYLREHYKYSGVDEFDHESKDLVYDFLFKTGSGENIHFSSAFVLLNRCIGIPARLVTGFSPGKLDTVTGIREVRGNDTHSWAEVYIPKTGWVPFDATPDGYLPAQQRETEYTAKDLTKKLGLDKEEKKKQLEGILNIAGWILAGLVALTALFFIGKKILSKLIPYLKELLGRGQEHRYYKKVVKAVKSSTAVSREPYETPSEYSSRVRQQVDLAFSEGKKTPSGLPENLDKFLDLYNRVYFGNQKEHMEDLRYYADLVQSNAKQSRSK